MLFPKTYQSLATVQFQGTVIALACDTPDTQTIIYYRVLRAGADPGDDGSWWPAVALEFPDEVRAAGASVITLPVGDAYPNGLTLEGSGFSAVADDTHVYVFRTSVQATILADRFLVVERDGEEAAFTLTHAREVRYQRSRNRDLPASARDTFGSVSLDGTPFVEPTLDLVELASLPQGCAGFCFALLPGPQGNTSRWLLATSTTSGGLSWTVFDRNDDGWFLPRTTAVASVALEEISGLSAPAALVYSQQEEVPLPLGKGGSTLKRSVHLMLAVSGCSGAGDQGLAIVDLALDHRGEPAGTRGKRLSSLSLPAMAAAGPLPVLARDGALPVSGAFVTAADAAGAVCPLESADGLIHVYYQSDAAGALGVLQVSPLVDRVVYEQPVGTSGQDGSLFFTARHAGIDPGVPPKQPGGAPAPPQPPGGGGTPPQPVQLTPSAGYQGAFCDVALTLPVDPETGLSLTETWKLVPADLGALVQVLTGRASHASEDDDLVREGKTAFYNFKGSKGRQVYALQPQPGEPPALWFVLRGRAGSIVAGSPALVVNVAGAEPSLTVACTVTYTEKEGPRTYQEVWLDIPLKGTPTCGSVAAILNGKPRGSSITYDYGNARYLVGGVFDPPDTLASGSQLFTVVAPLPDAPFPTAAFLCTLVAPDAPAELALPLSAPAAVSLGPPGAGASMPGSGVWSGVLAGSFTIESWFRAAFLPGPAPDASAVVTLTAADNSGALILALASAPGSGGCVAAALVAAGGNPTTVDPTVTSRITGPAVADTGWHHLALVCERGTATVFLDGVAGEPQALSLPFGSSPGVGFVTFGLTNYVQYEGQQPLTLPLPGNMAEVRLWSRAVTAAELTDRCLVALDPAREDGLVARWPLNDGGTAVQGYGKEPIEPFTVATLVWAQPASLQQVPQGVSYSGTLDPKPPLAGYSRLFVPSTRGVSPDGATLAGQLTGPALTPARVWPKANAPVRVPSLVGEEPIPGLGFQGTGQPGQQSVVTFPHNTFGFEGDLSFETWIQPLPFATGKRWAQRVVESRSGPDGAKTDFTVALRNLWSVQLDGASNWLELGSLPIPDAVSIVMRLSLGPQELGDGDTDGAAGGDETPDSKVALIGKYDASFGSMLRVRCINGQSISVVLGEHDDDDRYKFGAASPLSGTFVLALTLLPATQDKVQGTNVSCYVNGAQVGETAFTEDSTAALYRKGCGDGDWVVGMTWNAKARAKSEWFGGTVDEVQIWSTAETLPPARLKMEETLSGAEPGLVTYLTFNEGPTSLTSFDRSVGQNHARLLSDGAAAPPRWVPSIAKNAEFASLVFGGGGRGSAASTGYPVAAGRWTHLAVTYQTDYLLRFGGATRLGCGQRDGLDFDRALTIEAWVSGCGAKDERPVGTILGKWGSTDAERSYLLEIDARGHVVFSICTGQQVAVTGTREGAPHRTDPANPEDSTVVLTSRGTLTESKQWRYVVASFAVNDGGDDAQGSGGGAAPYDPRRVQSAVTMAIFLDGTLDVITTLPPTKDGEQNKPPTGAAAEKVQAAETAVKAREAANPVPHGTLPADGGGQQHDDELSGRVEIRRTPVETMIGGTAGRTVATLDRARVAEIRAWSRPLDVATVAWVARNRQPPNARTGLVAYWAMDEGKGLVVHDRAGGNDATSAQPLAWEPSTLAAVWRLYVDGVQEPWVAPLPGIDVSYSGVKDEKAVPGMTLGAFATGDIDASAVNATQWLGAYLSEVRVWRSARTPAEVAQWTGTRVAPSATGLAGYWPVTAADQAAGTLKDHSPAGNDGSVFACRYQNTLSAPPLRNEAGLVVNALGNPPGEPPVKVGGKPVKLPAKAVEVDGTPAVFEYGALVRDGHGVVTHGVVHRAHALPTADGTEVRRSLVVGSLCATYIGQVQFAPTLVGYIEGAPPVPSEDLVRPYWKNPTASWYLFYDEASRLSLVSDSTDRFVVSGSRESTAKTSVAAKLSLELGAKLTRSEFLGLWKETYSEEGELGIQTQFEHTLGWLSDVQRGVQTGRARRADTTLYGEWERFEDGHCAYPRLGRRYLPDNVGSALVRSGTADVYALTLEQSGSLVAYQMAPDPDVPEDWNIVMFPIRKDYVRNGVLDGFVGFWPAEPESSESYFRPAEAYRLKRKVEQETRELEMYYEQFAAAAAGRSGDALESGGDATLGAARPQRSLVNTYVWTAGGGLFREEMRALSLWEDASGGSYEFSGEAGLFGSLNLGAEFSVGEEAVDEVELSVELKSSFETMFGGALKTVVTKDAGGESALDLDVDVTGETWLRGWDEEKNDYTEQSVPGKVDGYRFMSYYLSPSTDHLDTFFADVVDLEWLEESPDPGARALRAAKGAANGVWRVLHRVTYVSRVPPRTVNDLDRGVPADDTRLVEAAVINEQNNQYLIRRVDAYLARHALRPGWTAVGQAIDALQAKGELAWMTGTSWPKIRPLLVKYVGAAMGLAPR